MKDFHQWLAEKGIELNEKGKRTALSANYPSLYHSIRQQPRQTWTPISATAPLADKQIGPDEKVTNGGPNVTDKKDNPYKNFYSTEWSKFLDKKLAQVDEFNQQLDEHPALLAVGRAALPHIAKGAGAAAINKMMEPKDKQRKKMCVSCKNEGPVLFAIGSGAKKLATTAMDKMTQKPAPLAPPQMKKCRKMMHQGDKPWMKTKGHPGKHEV